MQRRTIWPHVLSLWEPVAFGSASSPIGRQLSRDVTTRHVRRYTSRNSHPDDSNKAPRGPVWTSQLREEVDDDRYRQVRAASRRSLLPFHDQNQIAVQFLLPPLSATDRQVEQELEDSSSRPIEVLQRCIKSGLATPHVLHKCFKAQYRDQKRYPRKKRSTIHQTQREDQLARTALIYMLQDPGKWTSVLYKDADFAYTLCYFAIIEGLQDTLMRFLRIEPEPDNRYWRAQLVAAIISAEDLLNQNYSADNILNFFFSLVRMREAELTRYNTQKQQGGSTEMPVLAQYRVLYTAAAKTRNILTRGTEPLGRYRTDPALYETFLQYFVRHLPEDNVYTQPQIDWILAELQLNHTAGYNEGPALKLLETYATKGQFAFLSDARDHGPHVGQSIANLIKRTADVSEANGNMAAARWVFNTFEKEYFTAKTFLPERIETTLWDLGASATQEQRLLCNALLRTRSESRRLLSEKAAPAPPAVQVASDPMAHANKFQNMLGPAAKEAKQPESQKRGFGL